MITWHCIRSGSPLLNPQLLSAEAVMPSNTPQLTPLIIINLIWSFFFFFALNCKELSDNDYIFHKRKIIILDDVKWILKVIDQVKYMKILNKSMLNYRHSRTPTVVNICKNPRNYNFLGWLDNIKYYKSENFTFFFIFSHSTLAQIMYLLEYITIY